MDALPAGLSVQTLGVNTIVDTGVRKIVFGTDSDGMRRITSSFPSSYSQDDIEGILLATDTVAASQELQDLGDFTISVVPVAAVEGALDSSNLPFSEAIVATGNGRSVAIGGVQKVNEFLGEGEREPAVLAASQFVANTSATVSANLARVELGGGSNPAASAVTEVVLDEFLAPPGTDAGGGQVAQTLLRVGTQVAVNQVLAQEAPATNLLGVLSQSFSTDEFGQVLSNLPPGITVSTIGTVTVFNAGGTRYAYRAITKLNARGRNPRTLVKFVGTFSADNFSAGFSDLAIAQTITAAGTLAGQQNLANLGEFVLHALPAGTFADFAYNGRGEFTDVLIATAGDVTILVGGIVKVTQGSAQTIRYVTAADIGVNTIAAGVDVNKTPQ